MFHLTNERKNNVDMMEMKRTFRYYNGRSFEAIALPYEGRRYEMRIVLPRKIYGLNLLKSSFSPSVAHFIDSSFVNTGLLVKIPQFSLESHLKVLLPVLGIANFSQLVKKV